MAGSNCGAAEQKLAPIHIESYMEDSLIDQAKFLRAIVDALPAFVFVLDHEIRVLHVNRAAARLVGANPDLVLRPLTGDLLHCLQTQDAAGGCGTSPHCADCVIRNSVRSVRDGRPISRQKWKMQLQQGRELREIYMLVSAAPLVFGEADLVLLTLEDVTEWVALRGLLPICAHCKKIRQDKEYWEQVEHYFARRSEIEFTHSICPDCAREFRAGIDRIRKKEF